MVPVLYVVLGSSIEPSERKGFFMSYTARLRQIGSQTEDVAICLPGQALMTTMHKKQRSIGVRKLIASGHGVNA